MSNRSPLKLILCCVNLVLTELDPEVVTKLNFVRKLKHQNFWLGTLCVFYLAVSLEIKLFTSMPKLTALLFDYYFGRNRIRNTPGSLLINVLSFLYSKKKFERVFVPAISDMREEYSEALLAGKNSKAKWVWTRGVLSVWTAALTDVPVSMSSLIVKIWKASQ